MTTLWGTDAALAKEEARIAKKRADNETRRQRFQHAHTRILGINVDALDAQVAANNAKKADDKEADRIERVRQAEIERVLESAAEEERMMREFTQNEIKKSWVAAIETKREAAAVPETPFDISTVGSSAAQSFSGNDPFKKERIKAQQAQMRRWVQEQVAEKVYANQVEKESSKSYADMLRAIEDIRDVAEKEEQDMRKYLKLSVKEQNDMLAASRRNRWDEEKKAWTSLPIEVKAAATSIDLRDNKNVAIDEQTGRIIRRDMFRGFNEAQQRRIIQENEEVLDQKRALRLAEAQSEEQWLMQQSLTQQAMEHATIAEAQLRHDETMHNLDVIKQQIELQNAKKAASKQQRFGAVEPGFFDHFGSSCR